MAVIKAAAPRSSRPKDFVVAIGIERRVNVNQVNASAGQFLELFEVVAAINDARVEEGAWTTPHPGPLSIAWSEGVIFVGNSASWRLGG